MAIKGVLADHGDGGATLDVIVGESGISHPTASRLLTAMEQADAARRLPGLPQRWIPGPTKASEVDPNPEPPRCPLCYQVIRGLATELSATAAVLPLIRSDGTLHVVASDGETHIVTLPQRMPPRAPGITAGVGRSDATANADGSQPFGRGELEKLTLDVLAANRGRAMSPQDIATAISATARPGGQLRGGAQQLHQGRRRRPDPPGLRRAVDLHLPGAARRGPHREHQRGPPRPGQQRRRAVLTGTVPNPSRGPSACARPPRRIEKENPVPHELETFADGTTAFASARLSAWHQLGTVTQDTMKAEEIMAAARLGDWGVRTIRTVGIDIVNGVEVQIPADDKRMTVRRNPVTGETEYLGIVGTDYTVVQNEQCAEMLDRLVDQVGGAHFETAGSLRRGKSVFVTMKLPDGDGDRRGGPAGPLPDRHDLARRHRRPAGGRQPDPGRLRQHPTRRLRPLCRALHVPAHLQRQLPDQPGPRGAGPDVDLHGDLREGRRADAPDRY